jgi:hypothetical protein
MPHPSPLLSPATLCILSLRSHQAVLFGDIMSKKCSSTTNLLTLALTTLTSLVDNSFECSICLDTYSDPYVIPECLHRFCGACVKESIRKCGAECPKCRARITTKRGLRQDKELQDMVRRSSGAELLSFSQQECCRS